MLAKRIIPCLDVDNGRVVKGIRFVSLTDAGDPVAQAKRYDIEGADELTFLDITAVMDAKREAMAEMQAQAYLQTYYAERADHRGNHARRASGDQAIRQAEAFQRVTPHVVSEL